MTEMQLSTIASLVAIALALASGALAIRARRRGQIALGLRPDSRALPQLGAGLLLGSVAFAAIFGASLLLGVTHVRGAEPTVETVGGGIVVLGVLAVYEELVFRVLLVSGLLAIMRAPWWAMLISVAVTVINHAFTAGVTALSLISAGLGGVMYTLAYLGSQSWWLPLGLHLAWNITQGPVLGYPVSGTVIGDGPLIDQYSSGPTWLSGGAYGPEAGLIAIAARLIAIAALVMLCRASLRWLFCARASVATGITDA